MDWPLGSAEDLHTEFKRPDALNDPSNIARAVVGFLNAEGGRIWIGVGETDGVATSVEAIPDLARQQDRIRDALVDLVEPAPSIGREVKIRIMAFPDDPDRGILAVDVERGDRGPYALLRQGTRAYLQRTGSRLRPMTREELASVFARSLGATPKDRKVAKIDRLAADATKWSAEFSGLKVTVRPVEPMGIHLDREALLPLLREPKLTGNRHLGWSFVSRYSELKPIHPDGYRFGEKDAVQWLEIWTSGEIEFTADLRRLQREPKSIWPLALLELPTSIMRLAKTLYSRFAAPPPDSGTWIILWMGIFGIRDWTLLPYSPSAMGFQFPPQDPTPFADDPFLSQPVVVRWEELDQKPDRCAYALIRQLYRAFGYEEDQVPSEYDRDSGELKMQG